MRTRLTGNYYSDPSEFEAAVRRPHPLQLCTMARLPTVPHPRAPRLTFSNAMTYNAAGSDVHEIANKLLVAFPLRPDCTCQPR